MKLVAVVPAYNAARHLPDLIRRIGAARPPGLLRTVIVDDGSRDDTARVAQHLAKTTDGIEVVVRSRNGGYGAAMKTGLAVARALSADRAASVHADGQYSPEALPALLDALDRRRLDLAPFVGKVVNPFERKFLLDLAERGVETIDLLPAFLRERQADAGKAEALYQAQDTHWTTRGLELAAKLVGKRIQRFPWYKGIAAHRRAFHTKDEPFTRHGDLHSRLPEAERAQFAPETLVGHQVVNADGTPYDDDPDSPIVLLGDSFTGVYELMDCEHAGVSAHIAKEIGYPVDLVMSYGGGPNVREKLLRRGVDKLKSKKLVIWMMTARDLYDHAEGWQPLGKK